jgi:type II secretory pathway pseudopilin PulG
VDKKGGVGGGPSFLGEAAKFKLYLMKTIGQNTNVGYALKCQQKPGYHTYLLMKSAPVFLPKQQSCQADQPEAAFTFLEFLVVLSVLGVFALFSLPALAGTKDRSKTIHCLQNVRQVCMGTDVFAQENGCYPLLYRGGASGWPTWTYDTNSSVVPNRYYLWWPDALRLEGCVKDPKAFSCPSLTLPARSVGGASSPKYSLGIGMNYPEIGKAVYPGYPGPAQGIKPASVTNPGQTLTFGDSGTVTISSKDLGSDAWVAETSPSSSGGTTYLRSPSDLSFSAGDARAVPRHEGRVVTGWGDGHAALIKNSQIGWQYAKGHPLALWDR